jgi:hypothetical protein
MEDFSNETAGWLQGQLDAGAAIDCELGSLIAAASAWTEDESELHDLVGGLVETGYVQLSVG